jgi:hypothetical protein
LGRSRTGRRRRGDIGRRDIELEFAEPGAFEPAHGVLSDLAPQLHLEGLAGEGRRDPRGVDRAWRHYQRARLRSGAEKRTFILTRQVLDTTQHRSRIRLKLEREAGIAP